MRDIKFRTYDHINRRMVYDFQTFGSRYESKIGTYSYKLEIRRSNKIVACIYLRKKDDFIFENFDELKTMQYTGLKDVNGVEIYEGDIVKLSVPDYETDIAVVKFEEGAFVVDYDNLDTEFEYLYSLVDVSKLEVIGNIFENKELLEEVE